MIDYKYPTASGLLPSGALVAHPMKIYFEKIINEERGKKFESIVGGKHQRHRLDIYSHRESEFKNPTILGITFEVEDI
jgi:hypothetical protein